MEESKAREIKEALEISKKDSEIGLISEHKIVMAKIRKKLKQWRE